MPRYADSIQRLIDQLNRLPGIGPKSAERLAFHLIKVNADSRDLLVRAIQDVHTNVVRCAVCGQWGNKTPCHICGDPKRDPAQICVVAETQDLAAIERTHEFHGVYHVLNGVLNPLTGVTGDDLNVASLVSRVQKTEPRVTEVIFGLNPDVEGETTMLYLTKLLRPLDVKLTRLARGLPLGSNLEYADEVTLGDALKGRRTV
ncbi:MAG: recombination mediator RecR [Patescibacteria group bacterium]